MWVVIFILGLGVIPLFVIIIKLMKDEIKQFLTYRLKAKFTYLIGSLMVVLAVIDIIFTYAFYGDTNNIPKDQVLVFFWFGKIAEVLTILGIGLSIVTVVDADNSQIKNDKTVSEFRDKTDEIIAAVNKLEEINKMQTDRYRELKNMIKKLEKKKR